MPNTASSDPNDHDLIVGKAKSLRIADNAQQLVMTFRDDTSAFDGEKTKALAQKGAVNNAVNAYIMNYLQDNGIPTHLLKKISASQSLVQRLEMLPIEFVVRNIAAGSLCKRYGIERGHKLQPPLFELFYKSDELKDPLITENHINAFHWAQPQHVKQGQVLSLAINDLLVPLFFKAGMILVDYKLEFGLIGDKLIMGDEFTPDGCRLWDSKTQDSLDKDRFREDKGDVVKSYKIVAQRLGISLD